MVSEAFDKAWEAYPLKKAKQKDEKERALKEAEDPDRTAKLKRDFGIDE